MIELLDLKTENTFGFRIDGHIDKADMVLTYDKIEKMNESGQKLNLYAEIKSMDLADVSMEAIKEEFRRLLQNPSILWNVSKGVLVTDIPWIQKAFEIECALIPTFTGKSFALGEEAAALEWLRTDQREGHRLDITVPEMVETSALKVVSGFAIGLLAAGLMNKKQRKALSLGVLAGTMIAGIPLAIKVLNNNRQLLGECKD